MAKVSRRDLLPRLTPAQEESLRNLETRLQASSMADQSHASQM